ncbi:MAG: protein phosphatase 2C domain-containing protein [Propionibacteriaceae bacterium]|jgi:protein phosphatase|nr:protein phosphatase 2C domain-containing protein [Propionibacteriaceae bacterium]
MSEFLSSVSVASRTDVGLRRSLNEDSFVAQAPVFIVADGMGGHDAGEVASGIVAAELNALVGREDVTVTEVKQALHVARRRIATIPAVDRQHAAGTTVTGVVLINQEGNPYWLVVNLGDSRTYRMQAGGLEQLSVDHSEVQELVDDGRLSEEEALRYTKRNVITRALGAGTVENPDYWLIPVEPGDLILACSDGLTDELSDAEIEQILTASSSLDQAADELIAATLAAGAHDNVTVILVQADFTLSGADENDTETTLRELAKFRRALDDTAVIDVIPQGPATDDGDHIPRFVFDEMDNETPAYRPAADWASTFDFDDWKDEK